MKSFSNQEIADYYDQTEIHYRRAWDLNDSLAMHYGYWRKDTQNFRQSLVHMNEKLAQTAGIKAEDKVLDAGCGLGGSALFLAKNYGCQVIGITLLERHVHQARALAVESQLQHLVQYKKQDYTQTQFPAESFDVIWTNESIVHAADKKAFVKECQRLLKPGGRLIMGEYYWKEERRSEKDQVLLDKWMHAWAIPHLISKEQFISDLKSSGLDLLVFEDITTNIKKSAFRMYYGSFFMTVLSALYRIYNPKVRFFADNHYKGLYYQYPALKKGLWEYRVLLAKKKL
ncbi:MAG: methyltransferase domain-containing protein [Bacteroidota bacterium]